MSDLSVLNEMDQYLEECLETELYADINIKEEGPTPPKVNRAKSPSRSSTSFNYQSYVLTSINLFLIEVFFFNVAFVNDKIY